MKRITTAAVLMASALIASPIAAQSQAPTPQPQERQRFEESVEVTGMPRSAPATDHFVTFSGPVSVPGVTLPAGTYIFRFPLKQDLSTPGTLPVIQILKQDRGAETYAMFHAIPIRDASRTHATDTYDVTWREARDEEDLPAIAALFLPGESTGYEFLYGSQS